MNAFKAYDIRGVFGRDFDADDVYRIGLFLPRLLQADKVLVGYDARESSPIVFEALCRGITDAGSDVHSIGFATTPMVYWGTARFGFPASVQITASHNPKEYNGLKISREKAMPVGMDSGLLELRKMVSEDRVTQTARKGRVHTFSFLEEYCEFQRSKLTENDLSLGVDCSNGMASLIAKRILGEGPEYLFDTIDGTFPNHEPNPLVEENTTDLKRLVTRNNLDLGIIFDGDADRVMFIDEKGRFISPDLMIAVMGHYFLKEEKGNVLHDIRTSKAVSEYVEKLGGTPVMWKVGHAYAKRKLAEIRGIYGGELAGHYYFRDFYNCDSGMLAAVIVISIASDLKRKGIKVSELIDGIAVYAYSGEKNYRIEEKQTAMDALRRHFEKIENPRAFFDFDGYRVEFKDWWFNVRPSNTEPYLRLVVEAKDNAMLGEKLSAIRSVLAPFGEPA